LAELTVHFEILFSIYLLVKPLMCFMNNNEIIIIIIIVIIASHEDEMNDQYNDKLCTSNEVIQ